MGKRSLVKQRKKSLMHKTVCEFLEWGRSQKFKMKFQISHQVEDQVFVQVPSYRVIIMYLQGEWYGVLFIFFLLGQKWDRYLLILIS